MALAELEAAAATDTLHFSTLNFTGYGDGLDGIGRRVLGGDEGDPSAWMFDDTYFWSTVYRWIGRDCRLPDPGMYAVVGMAAFLSGSGRITLMLATVIIELTDDGKFTSNPPVACDFWVYFDRLLVITASLIGPVGVASIIAMLVGNMFNHGLYHGLIPVMNMPFLNSEAADVMNLVKVGALDNL